MELGDYKVVLFRNQPGGWVAEVPSIPGCHALTATPEEAMTELAGVFRLIEEEYRAENRQLPIIHAGSPNREPRTVATS